MTSIQATDPRESRRLRDASAGADQGPGDQGREISAYIAGRRNSALLNQQDPTNVSFPFLRRMARDHGVAMALHYIQMPLVKASFFFEADDARAAAFADNIVRPIFGSTVLTICRFLSFGYSGAVKNTMTINPGWQYLIDGEKKQVWDSTAVDALVYKPLIPLRPESCRLSYENGRFNGIRWDDFFVGGGSFYINGTMLPQIDLAHSFWAAHAVESEDGDPYGFPRIAHCAPIFHMYRYIWTLLGRAFENNADPGPIVEFPKDDTAVAPGEENNLEAALRIGRRKRSGSTIAIPSDVYTDYQDRMTNRPKWAINYPESKTNFVAIQDFMGYLEALKYRALWISEQSLMDGSGSSSSRNVVASMSSQRDASQAVLMEQIVAIIMDQIVRPAMAINMPWYEGKLEMKTIGFGKDDEDTVRQIFQLIGQNDTARLGIDIRRLAEARGFPMLDPIEQQKLLQQEATKTDAQPAPGVTPTQGRRALVTQTGFGESMYVQINDPIRTSSTEDGDFVASLPREGPWAIPATLDAARVIRSNLSDALKRSHRDASFYARRRGREMDEMLSDEGADPEQAATALMGSWSPDHDMLARAAEAYGAAITRAYDASLSAELRRLGAPPSRRSGSDLLAEPIFYGAIPYLVEAVRADVAHDLADPHPPGARLDSVLQRAAFVAVEHVRLAHARAILDAGEEAGVALCQIVDGADRGEIVQLSEARNLGIGCGSVRLLPSAPASLRVEAAEDDEYLARYDEEGVVVQFSDDLGAQQRQDFMVAFGDRMAVAVAAPKRP